MKKILLLCFSFVFLCSANLCSQVITYNYTGSAQTYTVPAGVTSINVFIWGAGGAGGDRTGGGNAGAGGSGAFVKGTLAVTPGDVYQIVVGGGGTYSTTNGTHAGGYGGGGTAYQKAGSGGGYSGIFFTSISDANKRGIAGGGGGGGDGRDRNFGGGGGATTGAAGGGLDATHTGGGGGTLAAGGAAGAGTGTTAGAAGTQFVGGNGGNAGSNTSGGAGGGGGYYGGGGGYGSNQGGNGGTWSSGGGGGSSNTSGLTSIINTAGTNNNTGGANNPAGTSETVYNGTAGVGGAGNGSAGGNGLVVIVVPGCTGTPSITSVSMNPTSPATGLPGSSITLTAVVPNVSGLAYQWESAPALAGPWTAIAGATFNPSTVTAPGTTGTTTYYRLALTCTNSGLVTNSSTTLSFTTSSACTPVLSNNSYINGVSTTGYATNITKTGTGWISPGYTNYYATANAQVTVPAASTMNITLDIVKSNGGPNPVYLLFYIDWNDDGLFDPSLEFIGYTTTNSNNNLTLGIPIPVDAPLGDHRLRIIAAKMGSLVNNPCLTGQEGESEDYKITIVANTCSATPVASPRTNYYYISQVAFIGTQVVPAANNTGAGLVTGYSDYTGLAVKAVQEQGEGVNVYVAINTSASSPRARIAAWVDWDKNGSFSFPSELVYNIDAIVTNNTTFGFQIPIGTAPGDYRIRIRSYNDGDDPSAPDVIISPCGTLYNGEAEDYLFTVKARCNAQIASVTGQSQCSSTPVAFSLSATGISASGFNWYNTASGGSSIGTGSSFTTPAIGTTTTYYVTATGTNTVGAACESFTRVAVVATYNTNITLTFNPAGPIFVCQGAGLSVQGGTSTETKTLISEDFESGGLGLFSVVNTTATPAASVSDMQWRNRTSVYVPTYTSVWQPAISSGFGTNKFALAVSDIASSSLNTSLQLTTAVSTVGFTSLTLEYDIFYDSYVGNGSNGGAGFDSIRVEVSTNNSTYTPVQSFVIDQGTGTQFIHQTLSLPGYINQSNLKIRFRYRADWVDGVAVDNIKLYGTTATSSSFTWLPTGPGADINSMYIDAGYVNNYIAGTNISAIFVNPTPTQIISGADLDFTASLTLSNGCIATGTITVKLNEKVWEGDEDANWHNAGNWCGDLVPIASTSVFIPAGVPNMPVISSAAAFANKVEIASGASLTINNYGTGSLTVSTDFITTGTLINNGTIILNGTSATAQNFPGTGTISAMNALQINNTGAGVSLNNNLRIGIALVPTAGNLSLNNSNITIGSDANRTAYVSQLGGTAGFTYNGTGRFIIERFIPARRAWRLMTAPVAAGSQTINQAWQEGVGGTWSSDPSPGYGTHVTGGTARTTAQGFDQGPFNASIYGYTGTAWNYLPATTGELVTSRQGWMLFVRGSRAINLPLSTPTTTPDNTTLRTRGAIKTGTQPAVTTAAAGFMVVGNPYPAPLNFKNITKSGLIGGSGGNNAYYMWDPALSGSSGVGAFVTFSWNSSTSKYDRSVMTGPGSSTISDDGLIPSSAAFMVNANAGASVTIEENDKDTVVYGNTYVFRPAAAQSSLRASLYEIEPDGSKSISDGNLVTFSSSSSNAVDDEDAVKLTNTNENFALVNNNSNISIERRNGLALNDTIFYSMWKMQPKKYEIEIAADNLPVPPGARAYIEDKFLGIKTLIGITETVRIEFDINANAASAAGDRFRIVIAPAGTIMPEITANVKSTTTVYPNPVKDGFINISFNNKPAAVYVAKLYNGVGQLVFEKSINHAGGSNAKTLSFSKKLVSGVYQLQLTGAGDVRMESFKLIVE